MTQCPATVMPLGPRGLAGAGASDPESRRRVPGRAVCCAGTSSAPPCLEIPYKQPLPEQDKDAEIPSA